MSDTLGNLLFLMSSDYVFNSHEEIMQNGSGILPEHDGWSKTEYAVPMPGSNTKYFIFSVSNYQFLEGLYYSVIDMTLDGGKGAVTSEKNIKLEAASTAQDKLFALKNADGDGYWIITRLFNDDRYISFRVTAAGVDPVPVYSPTGIYRPLASGSGPMRVSPDKKHLVSCYWINAEPPGALEVCDFNAETGMVTFKYLIEPYSKGKYLGGDPADCEFSPDSKFLYVQWLNTVELGLYQYNMKLVNDSAAFYNSGIDLLEHDGQSIQLSNDGRIYFTYRTDSAQWEIQNDYLGVINKPWEMGLACELDTFGIYLGGRDGSHFTPNIVLDYLYRFEWEAEDYCQGSPVHFIPHFLPTPDSIRWFFDEFAPGSISYELAPTYTFQNAGIHEVSVDIWYPTGRYEHTSREIEISPSPLPLLGPDTLICQGSSLTLNANCTADMYSWSTGQFGSPEITVSDSGTYWVRASFFETGCAGYDTIHVGFHPATTLDESELVITPTSCSGTSGSITGLHALGSPPYAYRWEDLSEVYFGTEIDVFNLPAGQYILTITDVNVTDETDFLGNGAIDIVATGSTPVIYYSMDGGTTYQSNNGTFNNLGSGIYNLEIKDENGCDTSFTVEIQNIILTYLHAVTGEDGLCEDSAALIPVYVDNFNAVANFQLKLGYNADILQCEGFINIHPQLLDSLTGFVDQAAGVINLAWNSPSPLTFTQPETVAELVFTTKNPGQGELSWYTGTTESYFTSASGTPIPAEFSTGEVIVYEPPKIILSTSKTVCEGQSVSFMGIVSGNQPPFDYEWTYPDGSFSTSDPFFFNVTQSDAGLYSLLVTDIVGCTDSKSMELIVRENPVAAFHGSDTLEMKEGDILDAGSGLSSYLWNTGDTTASILINAEGMYLVEMESPMGCLGSDAVYVKLVSEEVPEFEIYIPNAFSPNGDGVNEVFRVVAEGLSIVDFRLSIFDRWGGMMFESSGIENGWDGKKNEKDCPGGVYVYKIVFSVDSVPGNQERVGVVMLVR